MTKLNLHPLTGAPVYPIGTTKSGKLIWPVMGGDDTIPPAGTVDASGNVTVPVTPPPSAAPQTFTAADLERARKEEKDKLYPQLTELQQAAKAFEAFKAEAETAQRTAAEQAAAAARAEAEEAARKRWEEEGAKTLLAETTQQFEARFQALEAEREQERAAFAKEQEFSQLQSYIQRRVGEETAQNTIAPQLVDFVSGNTPEEVEASIANLRQRTDAILESVQQAAVHARSQMRGVSPAGYSTSGPMDTTSGTRTYSPADIAAMPMNEYAKVRNSLLGAASVQQNRGLYG